MSVTGDRDEVAGRQRQEAAKNGAAEVRAFPALPVSSQQFPAPREDEPAGTTPTESTAEVCLACGAGEPTVTAQHGREVYLRCSRCGLLWRIEQDELAPRGARVA